MISEGVREILEHAGVMVNGPNPWDIQVNEERLYPRIWREKNLGLGESYMDGWWECARLDEFIYRLLRSGVEEKVRGNLRYLIRLLPELLFNL